MLIHYFKTNNLLHHFLCSNGSNNFDEVAVFGNSYHIMCSLDAIIQLNGETISGQSHTINNFSESDQGTYKCVCHQGMGDPVESKELILVGKL